MAYADDFTKDAGGYNVAKTILDEEITLIRYFDCTVNNLSASGIYKVFAIPAEFLLTNALIVTETAEGAAGSMALTVNETTAVLIPAANVNAEGANIPNASSVLSGAVRQYYFASSGFISITPDSALDAWKGYIMVKGINLSTKY